MRIDQRNAGAAVTTSNTSSPWITDRWRAYSSANTVATAIHTTQQQTTVVPSGFSHALKTTVTFGGSSYERAYYQIIEGLNVGDLQWGTAAAKTITVSFWVQASITGTFAFSLRNYDGTRSYVSMQTINSANTWEQKTITIPGPTSGTWTVSNSFGIICEICLGHSIGISASLLTTATPNTWVNANAITTSSLTNFVGTTGTIFYFTGFQFEVGSTASSFEYRPYTTELALCQRYYVNVVSGGSAIATGFMWNVSELGSIVNVPVTMRSSPSLVQVTGTAYYAFERAAGNQTFSSFSNIVRWAGQQGYLYTSSSGTTGHVGELRGNNAASYIAFSSEL
jgi:hypothetical protein